MAHTQKRGREPINTLYPELAHMGSYSAWSWGVSRLIDGLELVENDLPVDRRHLAVTGCSFAGKMALFAGAFDERIALTIAQEPGGGGAAAWRVSETLGKVETLGATSRAWFIEDMYVTISPFASTDHMRWIDWWGKGKPVFPKVDPKGVETVTFEAEGAAVGSHWEIAKDDQASNGAYAAAKEGIQSIAEAPPTSDGTIEMPFPVKTAGSYVVFARLNCPTADDDSFWVRMDDGPFVMCNGLGTGGWSWVKLHQAALQPGRHTLTIGLREDGAKLDKIRISNHPCAPQGMGEPAGNIRASR